MKEKKISLKASLYFLSDQCRKALLVGKMLNFVYNFLLNGHFFNILKIAKDWIFDQIDLF